MYKKIKNSIFISLIFFISIAFAFHTCYDAPRDNPNDYKNVGGEGSTNVPVTGIGLNKSTTTIDIGSTEQITATIEPTNATNQNVTWSSSDESKATVSSSGLVTAVAAGTAIITVTTEDGGFTATCEVTAQIPNVKICTAADNQSIPQITSDGAGGAIITWMDNRYAFFDIYVQRIDVSGVIQWITDGVAICTGESSSKFGPRITNDGSGGAIVTWEDYRSGDSDIYAQLINASGAVQWTEDGISISTAADIQYHSQITSDGSGGAIITWEDWRNSNCDIYAQRINASGTVQWTADGVAICTDANDQNNPQIISDGAGGAIITWDDERAGVEPDIYAQRINASGVVQWTANGTAICTDTSIQWVPKIISDGANGAIITWYDERGSNPPDIYAQRINASGVVQWTANGVAICTADDQQGAPQITSDDASGAIITWIDSRNGSNFDIYVQRINASGAVQWTADGVAICTAVDDQLNPRITSDGVGGAIITWKDERGSDPDIYAQRISASGIVQWTADGLAICIAANDQVTPQITSDSAGGAIITWEDKRESGSDIYAQGISASGEL